MKSAIAVITLRARSDFGSGFRPEWISINRGPQDQTPCFRHPARLSQIGLTSDI
jgi:hypothetical protein